MVSSRPAGVDARLIETLEKAFAQHAGHDRHIDARELQNALGLRSEYLASRVLVCLDQNGDGLINRDEFLDGVKKLIFARIATSCISLFGFTITMATDRLVASISSA